MKVTKFSHINPYFFFVISLSLVVRNNMNPKLFLVYYFVIHIFISMSIFMAFVDYKYLIIIIISIIIMVSILVIILLFFLSY